MTDASDVPPRLHASSAVSRGAFSVVLIENDANPVRNVAAKASEIRSNRVHMHRLTRAHNEKSVYICPLLPQVVLSSLPRRLIRKFLPLRPGKVC